MVAETENSSLSDASFISSLIIVDLPVPDGADIIMSLPLFIDGSV